MMYCFFSSRRRHTRSKRDWSSDVCSSDLACSSCDGLGTRLELDDDLLVPDKTVSLKDGAIEAWRRLGKRMTIRYNRRLREFSEMFGVKPGIPFEKIDPDKRRILLHGTTA